MCWRRAIYLLIALVLVSRAGGFYGTLPLALSVAATLDHLMYVPIAARPVPTPTPTPTATPLPPLLDVRIEGEDTCSSFRGGSRQDANGEYVCFRNYGLQPADMTGWLVEDASQHRYSFLPFVLGARETVRLHSGPGADTATDLYWGRGLVWNNDHDTVFLYDAVGRLVSRYVY